MPKGVGQRRPDTCPKQGAWRHGLESSSLCSQSTVMRLSHGPAARAQAKARRGFFHVLARARAPQPQDRVASPLAALRFPRGTVEHRGKSLAEKPKGRAHGFGQQREPHSSNDLPATKGVSWKTSVFQNRPRRWTSVDRNESPRKHLKNQLPQQIQQICRQDNKFEHKFLRQGGREGVGSGQNCAATNGREGRQRQRRMSGQGGLLRGRNGSHPGRRRLHEAGPKICEMLEERFRGGFTSRVPR